MQIRTVSGSEQNNALLLQYFALRKRYFVDQLGWDIPHDGTYERDQYDHQGAFYTLVVDGENVVAGARFLRTDTHHEGASYMILDAVRGRLANIPQTIFKNPPRARDVYEVTRFVITEEFGFSKRYKTLNLLFRYDFKLLQSLGAKAAMVMMDPGFKKIFETIGYQNCETGPVIANGDEKYCVIYGQLPTREEIAA